MNTDPIKQKILEEIQQEKEKEYEQHLNKMIQKYCTDHEFEEKLKGG